MLKVPAQHVVDTVRTHQGERIAVIRTTDRGQFRHCRRKWNWSSAMRENLRAIETPGPLWFGTGMHYALEDFHGLNVYGRPENAFSAFVQATAQTQREDYRLPPDYADLHKLGHTMMKYYRQVWLKTRDPLKTFVYNGRPQTEVNLIVEVPFDLKKFGYDKWWDRVIYAGTIDRVIEDEYGTLWLVDYKSTKMMTQTHLQNDPQVCTYTWLASHFYPGHQIGGFIYWQFLKTAPKLPRQLKNGHISVAKNLMTSHELYRLALKGAYGVNHEGRPNAPQAQMEYWAQLMVNESANHDRFIRRDYIPRSMRAIESEGELILMELEDILNQNLPLYPNRNWMCKMCEYYEPCISLDDGSDWQEQIGNYAQREGSNMRDAWKRFLPTPESFEPKDPGQPMDIILEHIENETDEQQDARIAAEEAREAEIQDERQAQEVY